MPIATPVPAQQPHQQHAATDKAGATKTSSFHPKNPNTDIPSDHLPLHIKSGYAEFREPTEVRVTSTVVPTAGGAPADARAAAGDNRSTVPSTRDIASNLEKGEKFLQERKNDQVTSEGGSRLVDDLTQAVRDAKVFVEDKNIGDAARNIVDHGKSAAEKQNRPQVSAATVKREELYNDASDVAGQLRRLAQLTASSPSFRNFLWDFYQLARDTFGPQIDDTVTRKIGQTDSGFQPSSQQGQDASALRATSQQQATGLNSNPVTSLPSGSAAPRDPDSVPTIAELTYKQPQPSQQGNLDLQHPSQGIKDARGKVTEARDKVVNTLPKEQRDQLRQRWQRLIDDVKEDGRLQQAVVDLRNTLFSLRDKYQPVLQENKAAVKEAAHQQRDQAEEAREDITVVQNETKTLIEKLASGKSLDPLLQVVADWVHATRDDVQLRQWLDDLYQFLNVSVQQPQKLQDDRHIEQLDDFIARGQNIFQSGRHKQRGEQLLTESRDYIRAINEDPATNRLRSSLDRVIQDLFVDNQGRFVAKPDVYVELARVARPILNELLANIHVPHVEERNDDMHIYLSNITLDGNELLPDQFDVKNVADVHVGKESKENAELHTDFKISSKGSTCAVKDVYFYYKKFSFPRMSDSGRVDVELARDGLSFDIDVELRADGKGFSNIGRPSAGSPRFDRRDRDTKEHSTFRVKRCKVNIDKLKLNFRDAKHETLYKLAKPFVVSKVNKEMSHAVEDQLYRFVYELDKAAARARIRSANALNNSALGDRVIRGVDAEDAAYTVRLQGTTEPLHRTGVTTSVTEVGKDGHSSGFVDDPSRNRGRAEDGGFGKATGGVTSF